MAPVVTKLIKEVSLRRHAGQRRRQERRESYSVFGADTDSRADCAIALGAYETTHFAAALIFVNDACARKACNTHNAGKSTQRTSFCLRPSGDI
jgi:hypothetical protein